MLIIRCTNFEQCLHFNLKQTGHACDRRTAHMTKDDRIASYKYSVLQHARKHNNITYTCKVLNVSRTGLLQMAKEIQ